MQSSVYKPAIHSDLNTVTVCQDVLCTKRLNKPAIYSDPNTFLPGRPLYKETQKTPHPFSPQHCIPRCPVTQRDPGNSPSIQTPTLYSKMSCYTKRPRKLAIHSDPNTVFQDVLLHKETQETGHPFRPQHCIPRCPVTQRDPGNWPSIQTPTLYTKMSCYTKRPRKLAMHLDPNTLYQDVLLHKETQETGHPFRPQHFIPRCPVTQETGHAFRPQHFIPRCLLRRPSFSGKVV